MLILRLYSQDKMNWLMAGFVVIWIVLQIIRNPERNVFFKSIS